MSHLVALTLEREGIEAYINSSLNAQGTWIAPDRRLQTLHQTDLYTMESILEADGSTPLGGMANKGPAKLLLGMKSRLRRIKSHV